MIKNIFKQTVIFLAIFLFSASITLAQSDSSDILSSIDYSGLERIYNQIFTRSSVSNDSYGSILKDILNHYGVDGENFCPDKAETFYDESSPVFTFKLNRAFISCMSKLYSLGNSIYAFYLLNGKMAYVHKPQVDLDVFVKSFPLDPLKKIDPVFADELTNIYQGMSKDITHNILDLMAQWVSYLYQDLETLDLLSKRKISSDNIPEDIGKRSVCYMILTISSLSIIDQADPKFYSSMSNSARVSAIFKFFFTLMYKTIFNPSYNPKSPQLTAYFRSYMKSPDFKNITTSIHKYLGLYWTRDNLHF